MESQIAAIKRQLGASLDMLETAMKTATSEIWDVEADNPPFWKTLHHTMFFVDFYFSTFDPAINEPIKEYKFPDHLQQYYTGEWKDEIPDETIRMEDSYEYFIHIRKNLHDYFDKDIKAQLDDPSGFEWLDMTKGELISYNIRHIMEHCAILNQVLKKHGFKASGWLKVGEI